MILNFVQSRKWKSIYLDFDLTPVQDPSLLDLIAVATRQTDFLNLLHINTDEPIHCLHPIGSVLEEEGTTIQSLKLWSCLFRREEAVALASGLHSNQTLQKLAFECCKFEEDSLWQLATSLTRRLEEIVLSLGGVRSVDDWENLQAGLSAFISSIPLGCCPRKLAVDIRSRFGSDGNLFLEGPLDALGNLLSATDCDLEDLTLGSYPGSNAHSFERFAEGLRTNHSLRKLMLRNLHLSDELAESLAGAFRHHSTLREVYLCDLEQLTDFGVRCIGTALLAMPRLKHLHFLHHRGLTPETADWFVQLMETNYSLEDFLFVPEDCSSLELQNRQAKVDVYCILNRAGRGAYVRLQGAFEGVEITLSILEQVNGMELSTVSVNACPTLRVSALYKSVEMMVQNFATISE